MRRPNLIAGLLIVLVIGVAPSICAQRRKQTSEHMAAIKKCNDDYKQAAKIVMTITVLPLRMRTVR